ncbi:LysR family transcriptional regulator [Carnobacterium maltaromaticum]|uniref:LysR family transcriptional regulator n=1 Tax=Carnobacterium maltaromaticum TaxID=2751 RepID=UPI0039BE9F66
METNDMKIFIEVAHSSSISKTATKLGYVQSNISKRIEKIETELNCKLFLRTNKGMKLLPEGELFMTYCNEILTIMTRVNASFSMNSKILKIGATQNISHHYLSSALFSETISVYTKPIPDLISFLKQSVIDLLIINREIDDDSLKENFSFNEEICWVQSKESEFKIENQPIVINRDSECPYRKATLANIQANQMESTRLIQVDTLDVLISMLEKENVSSILPKKILKNNDKLKKVNTTTELSPIKILGYTLVTTNQVINLNQILTIE